MPLFSVCMCIAWEGFEGVTARLKYLLNSHVEAQVADSILHGGCLGELWHLWYSSAQGPLHVRFKTDEDG
jgi:hypothetical protein